MKPLKFEKVMEVERQEFGRSEVRGVRVCGECHRNKRGV